MLHWLAMIAVALAGVLLSTKADAFGLTTLPGYVFAIATAIGLGAIYAVASLSHRGDTTDEREISPWAALALVALTMAAIVWLRPQLVGPTPTTPEAALSALKDGPVAVRIRRSEDQRFISQGQINGAAVNLVIDTGAQTVMLKSSDAQLAGVDLASLTFDSPVKTANGTAYAAAVRLDRVSVGLLTVRDVEALIVKPGSLNESLLGMSFLRRLKSYDLTGDFMTLRN